MLATTMFPMERIGSTKNAFVGYVDDVRLGTNAEFASTMPLDYAVITVNQVMGTANNPELAQLMKEAEAIFAAYNSDASKINELAGEIQTVLDNSDYEQADYSRIESLKKTIPSDLSPFTEESVAWLKYVLSQIRTGLPAEMQSTVDGYEKMLEDALAGLTLVEGRNINYVDNAQITATASSYQDNGSAPSKALDGDPSTMWHSKWDITTMPHWIDLEMAELTSVDGLTYVPRQSGTNGNVTKYEIQISDDGTNYTTRATGTLKNNAAAAELKLHQANVPADIDGLNAVIKEAKAIQNEGFTAESWKALQEKIADAESLAAMENADANDVETMKRELSKAMVSLVLEQKAEPDPEPEKVSKKELEKFYNECLAFYKEKNHSKENWKAYQDALAAVKAVLDNDKAIQEDVDKALGQLVKITEKMNKELKDDSGTPQKPSNPSGTGGNQKPDKNSPVKTGDGAPILFMAFMVFAAGAVLVIYGKRARKR